MSLDNYKGTIKTFDILYLDKIDGELKIEYRNFLPEKKKDYEVLGICVIPSGHTLDGYARFMGFNYQSFALSNRGIRNPDPISDLRGEENTKIIPYVDGWIKGLPHCDKISWYIPAIGELRYLLSSMESINEVLKEMKLKKYSLLSRIVISSSVSKASHKMSDYRDDYFYKISMRNPFKIKKDDLSYPTDLVIPFCKI